MNSIVRRPGMWPLIGLSLVTLLLAGCASSTPAPVRNGTPAPTQAPVTQSGAPQQVHIVRPGDTLMGISRLYGQNVNDLVVWNSMMDPNQLRVGQQVRIAPPGSAPAAATAQPIEVRPVQGAAAAAAEVPVKHEPRGGRQPYSDQAWAALRPPASAASQPPAAPEVPAPVPQDAAWLWPAKGPVIAGFNEATNKGVDIGGAPGDPVIASAAGRVVYSGSGLRGYGKLVIIKHDDSYLTAYAHNQSLLVKEGDAVGKGQRIAELGSTDADRPKLHFEIRRQGRPVDPMQYLPPR